MFKRIKFFLSTLLFSGLRSPPFIKCGQLRHCEHIFNLSKENHFFEHFDVHKRACHAFKMTKDKWSPTPGLVISDKATQVQCPPGRTCLSTPPGLVQCICIPACPQHWNPVRKNLFCDSKSMATAAGVWEWWNLLRQPLSSPPSGLQAGKTYHS